MERLLHEMLRRASVEHPDRVAVQDGNRTISYAQLEARSNQMASLLSHLGVSRGDRVGLYLDKSLESIVGIYGALKTGAAYVPLDPRAPVSRIAYIAADCDISVLVSGAEKAGSWNGLLEHGAPLEAIVVANAGEIGPEMAIAGVKLLDARDIDQQPDKDPRVRCIGQDLAYILYTSGSTGDPKGVMLSHLNALTFVHWGVNRFGVGPEDRLSNHAPLHFDLSVFDLFAAAAAGATVVLVPPELSVFPVQVRDFIEHEQITIWYSVPSLLSMLTLRGGLEGAGFESLRTILFAGEVFPTRYLRELMGLLPHVEFFNLYGPTETNVCTYFPVSPIPEEQTEPIPIGHAIDDVEVFAVTDQGALARPGEVGELLVRGTTVMQGYWGDDIRTERALVPDPVRGELRDPVYRTGDLVRRGDDGEYRLLGRRDHQIKSRGYRIELGEIESALYVHPAVVECVAVAVPDPLVTNRIKAFVVGRDGLKEEDVIRFCGERIPHYMVPEEIEFVAALPKTSTGKIDRQAVSAAS